MLVVLREKLSKKNKLCEEIKYLNQIRNYSMQNKFTNILHINSIKVLNIKYEDNQNSVMSNHRHFFCRPISNL